MNFTATQLNSIKRTYELFAKEPIEVEVIKSGIYLVCSELASLRIYRKLVLPSVPNSKVTQGFSENLGVYFVCIEIN